MRQLTHEEMIQDLRFALGKLPASLRPKDAGAAALMLVDSQTLSGWKVFRGEAMDFRDMNKAP